MNGALIPLCTEAMQTFNQLIAHFLFSIFCRAQWWNSVPFALLDSSEMNILSLDNKGMVDFGAGSLSPIPQKVHR